MKFLWIKILIVLAGLLSAHHAAANNFSEAESLIASGEAKQAAKLMETALEGSPQQAEALYWLARAELAQIDDASIFRKASLAKSGRKNLEEAVRLAPDMVEAREALARFYLEAPGIVGGSKKAAKNEASVLLKQSPPAGYRVMAAIANSEEDYTAAVDWMEKGMTPELWNWDSQYQLIVLAVHRETSNAESVLTNGEANVQAYADKPEELVPLIDYQRGKLAAVAGVSLEQGQASLERYLQHTPGEGQPELVWAEFRLAQVERQLGLTDEAEARLSVLEATQLPEDLAYTLRDERRWHYSD